MYKRDFTWGPIVSNAEILAHPSQLRLRGRSRQTWYSWPASSRRLHCRRREGEGAVSADVTFLPVQQPRRTADDGKGDRADVTFLPALQQTTGRGKVRLCRRNIPNIPDETVRGTSPLGPALGAVIGRAVEAVNLHRHVEGWPNYSQGLVYYYMDRTRAKGSEDSVRLEILTGRLS